MDAIPRLGGQCPGRLLVSAHRRMSTGDSGGQTFAMLGVMALNAHSTGLGAMSLTVIMTEFQVAEKTSVSLLPW